MSSTKWQCLHCKAFTRQGTRLCSRCSRPSYELPATTLAAYTGASYAKPKRGFLDGPWKDVVAFMVALPNVILALADVDDAGYFISGLCSTRTCGYWEVHGTLPSELLLWAWIALAAAGYAGMSRETASPFTAGLYHWVKVGGLIAFVGLSVASAVAGIWVDGAVAQAR